MNTTIPEVVKVELHNGSVWGFSHARVEKRWNDKDELDWVIFSKDSVFTPTLITSVCDKDVKRLTSTLGDRVTLYKEPNTVLSGVIEADLITLYECAIANQSWIEEESMYTCSPQQYTAAKIVEIVKSMMKKAKECRQNENS